MHIYPMSRLQRILFCGIVFLISGFLFRFFLPSFALSEVQLHSSIRNMLGFPLPYYSNTALFVLTLFYEIFYFFLGSIIGVVLFKFRLSSRTRRVLGILFFILLYGFLRVDVFNRYQTITVFPSSSRFLSATFATVTQLFVPKIAIETPSQSPSSTYYPTPPSQTNPPATPTTYHPNSPNLPLPTHVPDLPPPQVAQMPTSQELFQALNSYRQSHGVQTLTWEPNIAAFAQAQASYFNEKQAFTKDNAYRQRISSYIPPINSFVTGETNTIGNTGTATHIINDVLGANNSYSNILSATRWTHVGIGVNGNAIVVVYGRHEHW